MGATFCDDSRTADTFWIGADTPLTAGVLRPLIELLHGLKQAFPAAVGAPRPEVLSHHQFSARNVSRSQREVACATG